jgi:hypothetical protein
LIEFIDQIIFLPDKVADQSIAQGLRRSISIMEHRSYRIKPVNNPNKYSRRTVGVSAVLSGFRGN